VTYTVICTHCQTSNREGRRFCAKCGAPLLATCAACGFLNEPQELFCGGCGISLSANSQEAAATHIPGSLPPTGATADRRPVTVMFVDLSGYTSLSATLDPEDTHRLLRRFFEITDGIVVDFGGTIDKHIGDNVMALFGAPLAHGNDPERAIRAALAIQAAMPALGQEFGRDMKVHIGLALGEVVASGLGSATHTAYTVTGDAANLAAKLMDHATSGMTLVAEALYLATQHIAVFEAVGPAVLKGVAQPQAVYSLTGLKSDLMGEPAMVGRQGELAQLVAVLSATDASGRGAAVALRGDPGIGKSRLLRELKTQATSLGFRCISGLVLDFGGHAGEDVLAAITAGLLGTTVESASQTKVDAIENACSSARISAADRPFVHDLLGLPPPPDSEKVYAAMDAKAHRRGMAAALARLLRTGSLETPHLVAVEDVHWANEVTLYILAQLAAAAEQCAAIIAMTTRFDGDPFDANWRAQSSGGLAMMIDLKPLRAEDAIRLASSVISVADEFSQQCVARAEGNPLFLEQLLRSRLDDSRGLLPHSVQGVVLARLDSLAEPDRRALQAASILGQRFSQDDLCVLINSPSYQCQPMVNRQLLRPEGDGYLFAHALIRDGVYASLTRNRRHDLHLKAATLYAERDPVLRAEHLDRAEDPQAVQAYLDAARCEAGSYRLERANAMATRGLELAKDREDRVRLGLAAGRLRLDAGQAKSAADAFVLAIAAADDDMDRCRGLVGLAAADRIMANIDKALESLRDAEIIAATADSPALLSEIHYMRGNLHFARGEGSACFTEHSLALEAAERTGQPEWKARAMSGLGDAAYLQGRIKTALGHFRNCVDLAEQHGLLRVIPANQIMIGDCLVFLLDVKGALDQVAAARATAVRIGDRFCEMFALQGESFILLAVGRIREIEASTEAGLELATKLGARRYEPFLMASLAQLRILQGRPDDARGLLDAALSIAEQTGLGFCGPLICLSYANLSGPSDEGRAWIARGEAMLAQTQLAHNHVFFRTMAIDWAIRCDEWTIVDRLAEELTSFTAVEPLTYADFYVSRARALAALKRNPDDQQADKTLQRLEEIAASADVRLQLLA